MKRTSHSAWILCVLVFVAASVQAQDEPVPEDMPRSSVDRYTSKNLSGERIPDGVIYRTFLANLMGIATHMSEEDAVYHIVDGFKLPHGDAGTRAASSLFEFFEQDYYRLEAELARRRDSIMCSPRNAVRTRDEAYEAFYRGDQEDETISDNRYVAVRADLTGEEVELLERYLRDLKESTGYKTIDYKALYEEQMHGVDIRDDLKAVCDRLAAKIEALQR